MQVNVVGQIFLTNAFLGGAFLTYGMEVVQFLDQDPETRVDPMARVFPRLTKCVFHKYGASGELLSLFEGFSHTETTINFTRTLPRMSYIQLLAHFLS